MHEYSSISVSSYEAGSLADRLTEQSRDGWDVVAIVPTGSTVTAYLSRVANAEVASDDQEPRLTHDLEPAPDESAPDESDAPPDAPPEAATVASVAAAASTEQASTEQVSSEPVVEPGGWAASDATTEPDAAPESAPAETAPVEQQPEQAAGAAPAGWYADPSSRYELRYWDGGQWTEHVSRGGQQYTDPPVA